MGNSGFSENSILEDTLDEYVELIYLNKSEIRQSVKEFNFV